MKKLLLVLSLVVSLLLVGAFSTSAGYFTHIGIIPGIGIGPNPGIIPNPGIGPNPGIIPGPNPSNGSIKVFASADKPVVEPGEEFRINAKIFINDVNRIDSVELVGPYYCTFKKSKAPSYESYEYMSDPLTISQSATFKLVVKLDGGKITIKKNVYVECFQG